MQRFHQVMFIGSLLALSWFAMLAVHEFGHVVGALATGGTVAQVVLHPLTISRTDVSPNPHPLTVVWLGPILGSSIPVLIWRFIPSRITVARQIGCFFAGFCLIANGAYIAFGSMDGVGDCGAMLRHGSATWTLLLFGAITIPLGLHLWHQLGPIKPFLANPAKIDPAVTYWLFTVFVAMLTLEFTFSPK
ncbi:MAG: hypothetical protein KDA87_13520 [Planctomycetales bacterium]|nr:hypothetical protein [Planctomycetales bacterium]